MAASVTVVRSEPPADRAMLPEEARADIQGFITSGYGHLPWAAALFLQIGDRVPAGAWLARLVPQVLTAATWPAAPSGETIKPPTAVNVSFTRAGLEALGLPRSALCTFPAEFLEGMAETHRSRILGDIDESAPGQWELGGPENPVIHVLLMLHAGSREDLARLVEEHRAALRDTSGAVVELRAAGQSGHRPPGNYEPFGFHDGMSQPAIRGISGHGVPTGEFILGYENHYGVIPPGPVVHADLDPGKLLPDLANPRYAGARLRDLGMNGSYVVYRKLRQDVAGFWRFLREESKRRTGTADSREMVWLASRLVGRWPGGAPLAVSPDRDDPALRDHDEFLYAGSDPEGLKCPVGAHARRANPRDSIKPYGTAQALSMSEAHRLLRRGTVFGAPLFDRSVLDDPAAPRNAAVLLNMEDDRQPRGLHFFCVNASIRSQFEFVQQTWCNNPRFSGLTDNADPILSPGGGANPPSCMRIPRCPVRERTAALPRFVTVMGGGYFFLPGIRALQLLASCAGR